MTMMITVPVIFQIQLQRFLSIGNFIFFMLVDLLEGILIAVGGTAGAEGEYDIADTAGHGEQEGRQDALSAIGRSKDEIKGILGVVEDPFAFGADDKRNKTIDCVGTIGKDDTKIREVEPISHIRSVPGGMDDAPGAGNILHRFVRRGGMFYLAGENEQSQEKNAACFDGAKHGVDRWC
jgi:hypothetical protein